MKLNNIVGLCILWTLACPAVALTPPPGGWPPMTFDALWGEVDRVFFGRVVVMSAVEDDAMKRNYIATIKVEKTWKGSAESTFEIKLMTALGDGMGYNFQIGRSYVVFLTESNGHFGLRYAKLYNFEEQEFNPFGPAGTEEFLPGGGLLSDQRSLRVFLESKTLK